MTIQVTQAHIDAGVRGNCSRCPVALAIEAALKSANVQVNSPYVGVAHVQVNEKTLTLPVAVWQFIYNFDSEAPVSPFSFELPYKVEGQQP